MPQDSITITLIAAAFWGAMRSHEWLAAFGSDEERIVLLLETMCDVLEGPRSVYVPESGSVRASIERLQRHAAIRAAFDGQNYGVLARQYGMSARQVRRIADRRPRKSDTF